LDRPLKYLLAAAAVASAPIPALAQSWPVGVVAGSPRMAAAPARPLVVLNRDSRILRRPYELPPTDPNRPAPLRLSAVEPNQAPEVNIRAKTEWADDQGFRLSPTRLAFKRRF
jgi:hypothetical protein